MNKFLSLLSTSLFFTGCLNSGSGGGFTTDSSPTNSAPALTLMNHLDEGLLWKSECETLNSSRSVVFYVSKSSNGKLLYEADILGNSDCNFDQWLQAIKKTYSFSSDNGSVVSGVKESNEYMILDSVYLADVNQALFCGKSDWILDQWYEISNSTDCDLTGLNSPISIGYQILGDGSVNFDGKIFNR